MRITSQGSRAIAHLAELPRASETGVRNGLNRFAQDFKRDARARYGPTKTRGFRYDDPRQSKTGHGTEVVFRWTYISRFLEGGTKAHKIFPRSDRNRTRALVRRTAKAGGRYGIAPTAANLRKLQRSQSAALRAGESGAGRGVLRVPGKKGRGDGRKGGGPYARYVQSPGVKAKKIDLRGMLRGRRKTVDGYIVKGVSNVWRS